MAVAERGSFMWFLFSITSFIISIKVMNDFEGYATTVFGGTGAAALMLAIILFRQEQRELLLNPMKAIEREVHEDAIAKQGKGTGLAVGSWAIGMLVAIIVL
mgnify:FL=1|jgi:hypothetical protein